MAGADVAPVGAEVQPGPVAGSGKPDTVVRHIVERADRSLVDYRDRTLCGATWDRVGLAAGPMCDKCARIFEMREGRPWAGSEQGPRGPLP